MNDVTNQNPKVATDVRGTVWLYKFGEAGVNVLFTKAGYYRGGHTHPFPQKCLIIKGEFEITLRQGEKDIIKKYGPGEVTLPVKIPHLWKALSDAVFVEWYNGEFVSDNFEPFRRLVEAKMKEN